MLSYFCLRQVILFLIFLPLIVSQGDSSTREELTHPRLFFGPETIQALQTQAAGSHLEIWNPILQYARQMVGDLPPEAAPTAGSFEEYRSYGNRLIPLAFACAVSQEATLCDLAKQTLLRYSTWEQWSNNNERALSLAHMILGNTIAYDWLYDSLSDNERLQVRTALGTWTQLLYEASSADSHIAGWENWWRKSYMQNYHWICNSALGLAGLTLLNEDDRAQTWVDQAVTEIERVKLLMDGIGDGSWHEGIQYQNYQLTILLPFLVNLERIEKKDLFPEGYLHNYVLWRVYNHLPGQFYPALAFADFEEDWGNGYEAQNILRLIASRYHDGLAEWMAEQLLAVQPRVAGAWETPWHVFEFLYYDPAVVAAPPVSLPRSRRFNDQESVVWRTGWDADALVFGLISGTYAGRRGYDSFVNRQAPWDSSCEATGCQLNIDHDHLDTNGFYLYQAGAWLAPETIGVGKRATSYHNTILIDGEGQFSPTTAYDSPDNFAASDGKFEITSSLPDFDYLLADATRRYKNISGIQQVKRQVLYLRPSTFILLDDVEASDPHRYEWVSHFGKKASVEGNWIRGDAGSDKLLGIAVVAPESFTNTLGNDGQPYVRIQPAQDSAKVRFIHLLYPTTAAQWNSKPTITLLENHSNWSALRVEAQDDSEKIDEILFNGGENGGEVYTFDGKVAVISSAKQQLSKLYMVDGTKLTDIADNRILLQATQPVSEIEVMYTDQSLAISGLLNGTIRIFAPGVQSVTLNGADQEFSRLGDLIQFCIGQC